MALLCRRKTLLYRELHGLGLRESYYSNGKFNRVISSFDQFRVSRMGISKAVQMQPAVKKPSHEEMTKERLPEPRPFDLYRSICSSDRRGGAVAALEGWLNGGRKAAKWEPNRVISDPMKYNRDIHPLQVGFHTLFCLSYLFLFLSFRWFIFHSVCMYWFIFLSTYMHVSL